MHYITDIEDTNYYKLSTELENYLKYLDVDSKTITKIKNKTFKEKNMDYIHKDKVVTEMILIDKIIGGSRFTVDDTIYDNISRFRKDLRDRDKFEHLFEIIEDNFSNNIDSIRLMFEDLDGPIEAQYYSDIDQYYIELNGNHRTLIAMMLGCENINARVTYLSK